MKISNIKRVVLVFAVSAVGVSLGACSGNRYCMRAQPYASAQSIPPLQSANGLTVPRAAGALIVPPPSGDKVPFGKEVQKKNGKSRVVCLDQPPPIPKPQGDTITKAVTH